MTDEDRLRRAFGIAIGGLLPILVAGLLVPLRDDMLNANVALVLVVAVVAAAVFGGRAGGAVAAVSATLSYNFFHTRPYLSLSIASGDDVETTLLLLVVGLVVGTVAARARKARASVEVERAEIRRIYRLAERVAQGENTADITMAAQKELASLLTLRDCRFEAPPYDQQLPRLERSGVVSGQRERRFLHGGFTLPEGGVELPVLTRGQQVGRFVLLPSLDIGVSLEQRVIAVAIADQVGGAVGELRPTRPR